MYNAHARETPCVLHVRTCSCSAVLRSSFERTSRSSLSVLCLRRCSREISLSWSERWTPRATVSRTVYYIILVQLNSALSRFIMSKVKIVGEDLLLPLSSHLAVDDVSSFVQQGILGTDIRRQRLCLGAQLVQLCLVNLCRRDMCGVKRVQCQVITEAWRITSSNDLCGWLEADAPHKTYEHKLRHTGSLVHDGQYNCPHR